MADWVFTKLYKDVFADLTVDATKAKELHNKFEAANPTLLYCVLLMLLFMLLRKLA